MRTPLDEYLVELNEMAHKPFSKFDNPKRIYLHEVIERLNRISDEIDDIIMSKWTTEDFKKDREERENRYKDINSERRLYYGLRVGDIIKCDAYRIAEAVVINYVFMDNNAIIVQEKGKEPRKVVAEWCDIITKVEDR